ncbi:MAG: beta-ketoacyl synthase chain length factor [Pseudomonadota bacterium]
MTLLHARMTHWAFWENRDDHPVLKTRTPDGVMAPTIEMTSANLAHSLKPAWRRRLDLYGRAAAEVLAPALAPGGNPHIVFASRHGNIDRTLKLLHQVATGETLSPADFGMSVHNALVGIASINWSITQSHTAIAAGADSFVAGMTETLCQLADQGGPVILCYVDLALPDVYSDNDPDDVFGVAFAARLEPAGQKSGDVFGFTPETRRLPDPQPHQQICALAAFLENPDGAFCLAGKTAGWSITHND